MLSSREEKVTQINCAPKRDLQFEIAFWPLLIDLCSPSSFLSPSVKERIGRGKVTNCREHGFKRKAIKQTTNKKQENLLERWNGEHSLLSQHLSLESAISVSLIRDLGSEVQEPVF